MEQEPILYSQPSVLHCNREKESGNSNINSNNSCSNGNRKSNCTCNGNNVLDIITNNNISENNDNNNNNNNRPDGDLPLSLPPPISFPDVVPALYWRELFLLFEIRRHLRRFGGARHDHSEAAIKILIILIAWVSNRANYNNICKEFD